MWTHQHINSWSLLRKRIKRRIKMLNKRLPRPRWNSNCTVIIFHDNHSYLKDNFKQRNYTVFLLWLNLCSAYMDIISGCKQAHEKRTGFCCVLCFVPVSFLYKLTVTAVSLPILPFSWPSRQEWPCPFFFIWQKHRSVRTLLRVQLYNSDALQMQCISSNAFTMKDFNWFTVVKLSM